MRRLFSILLYLLCVISCTAAADTSVLNSSQEVTSMLHSNTKILSRRKRYLVFPEGSSFQVVYCLTVPLPEVVEIFALGLTASLAWQLPEKPYHLIKQDEMNRRHDLKKKLHASAQSKKNTYKTTIYKVDPHNEPMYHVNVPRPLYYQIPYQAVTFLKPVTLQESMHYYQKPLYEQTPAVYYKQPERGFVNIPSKSERVYKESSTYSNARDEYNHKMHHVSRRDLYSKLEKLFNTLRKDGRACILKALCEISQSSKENVGSFTEELMRAVFTWRTDHNEPDNHHYREYDKATQHSEDCEEIYSSCSASVWNGFLG